MDLILTGVLAGVLGTLVMDLLNLLFAYTGVLLRIDVGMIGRMSAGWARGRFCYSHPSEMKPAANEKLIGFITHYSIGVALAIPFVLGWAYFFGGPASPMWALAYGVDGDPWKTIPPVHVYFFRTHLTYRHALLLFCVTIPTYPSYSAK